MSSTRKSRRIKQRESRERLKFIVGLLQQENWTDVAKEDLILANISMEEFRLHKVKEAELREALYAHQTYDSIRTTFELEALATLRRVVLKACRKYKKSKLNIIAKLARKLKPNIPWVPPTFNASLHWCQEIRKDLVPDSRQRNKNAEYEQWVMEQIETHGEVTASSARKKCDEMLGQKSYSAWQNFSRRIRHKLGLESTSKEASNRNPIWILA